jgi:hypothetical protein
MKNMIITILLALAAFNTVFGISIVVSLYQFGEWGVLVGFLILFLGLSVLLAHRIIDLIQND